MRKAKASGELLAAHKDAAREGSFRRPRHPSEPRNSSEGPAARKPSRASQQAGKSPRTRATTRAKSHQNVRAVTYEFVRDFFLQLPGVEEAISHKITTFRAHGRMLARFRQGDDSLLIKVAYVTRDVLIGSMPDVFYVTNQNRCWPLMSVRLEKVKMDLLMQLIEETWRAGARKRELAQFNARRT